ncbi:TolB family protein [Planobispora takensis]|uniref:WD40-like Beta Propeller Repeat n=1 Tax=Planobispora takensis TaxID=1367882 RepID=A0A8J3T339_9ACTN|nr:PD40 domain-containing protein [Planobispora takensis]GII00184.1 hypothetical protein Pta02_21920 [Planobispora takensis]
MNARFRNGRSGRRLLGAAAAGLVTAQLVIGAAWAGSASAAAPATEQISLSGAGQPGDSVSDLPSVSTDGRFVAFDSISDNLGSTAGRQVYLRDRTAGTTTLVSVRTGGAQAGPNSSNPAVSGDGRFVAFQSFAADLVGGDTNNAPDVFVHDTVTRTTKRVSVATNGTQGNGISANPAISPDGRYVVFESEASSLVNGDTNGVRDVFLHDRDLGLTTRVSLADDDAQANGASTGPSVTRAGTAVKIAFQSAASNLVSGDTAGATDVFVRTLSGGTVRASVSSSGAQGDNFSVNPVISADGRFVAFESRAANLEGGDTNGRDDVFRHDLTRRTTVNVVSGLSNVPGNGSSRGPSISADGRFVAFRSNATNLVFGGDANGGTQDVFVADLNQAEGFQNTLASVTSTGAASDDLSDEAALSADGRTVAFASEAGNLVPGDGNLVNDVFLRVLR